MPIGDDFVLWHVHWNDNLPHFQAGHDEWEYSTCSSKAADAFNMSLCTMGQWGVRCPRAVGVRSMPLWSALSHKWEYSDKVRASCGSIRTFSENVFKEPQEKKILDHPTCPTCPTCPTRCFLQECGSDNRTMKCLQRWLTWSVPGRRLAFTSCYWKLLRRFPKAFTSSTTSFDPRTQPEQKTSTIGGR